MDTKKLNCPHCGEEITINLEKYIEENVECIDDCVIIRDTYCCPECHGCFDRVQTSEEIKFWNEEWEALK